MRDSKVNGRFFTSEGKREMIGVSKARSWGKRVIQASVNTIQSMPKSEESTLIRVKLGSGLSSGDGDGDGNQQRLPLGTWQMKLGLQAQYKDSGIG
jgi:hypothetical protein